ncbi:MAG: helix-hairpin-helix domain-containing protein [Acidobacteriota bacterium]|nr:helix-hairpin-helix domain-containing protein [Acidobacteriota bacterium]
MIITTLEDSMRRLTFVIGMLVAALVASAPAAQAQAAAAAAKKAPAAARVRATPGAPVNLNAATLAQLQTLPGVGVSTAQRIVDYRQKNGAFKKVEELMNVKGLGEKSFLKLKPLITVAEKSAGADGQK